MMAVKTSMAVILSLLCVCCVPEAAAFIAAPSSVVVPRGHQALDRRRRGDEALGKPRPRRTTAVMSAVAIHGGGAASLTESDSPGLWRNYMRALEQRPILTKSLSSGLISATANFVEQTISAEPFNLKNWTSFALVGTCFVGWVLHFWFKFLDSFANSKFVTSRIKSRWGPVVVQVLLDQTFGAAIVNSGYFAAHTICSAALTGQVFPLSDLVSSIEHKVTSRFAIMMINNVKMWPWVSFANFAFVPMELRVLVSNFFSVFWGYLMSKWCK